MPKEKTFYINLKVTQFNGGEYDVNIEQLDFLSRSTLTKGELSSIKEGCVLIAKELTNQYRKEVFEDADPNFA